jgi:thiol-disulfide isomerase/thioredoxin
MPQKFPSKESSSNLQSDVEKYDEVFDSLNSIQARHKNSNPVSNSSIRPSTLVVIIVILSVFSLILLSFGNLPAPIVDPLETNTALSEGLDFKIQLLDESEVMLSDYIGEPIILDLFATWCVPCLTQISHLQTIHSQYPNVRILSISVYSGDTLSQLNDYKADHGMNWVVGRDISGQALSIYQASSIPTMAFFDANAILKHREIGVTTAATLISWINGN